MTTALLLGGGLGTGLWALAVWLIPPPPALATALRRAAAPATAPHLPDTPPARPSRPAVVLLRAAGLPTPAMRRDLTVLDRPVDAFLTEKTLLALTDLLGPTIAVVAITALGGGISLPVPIALAAAAAVFGFLTPDLRLRRRAAQRRADFRHALSAFLDLVVISLAGGAGVDSALTDAASTGHGWAFTHLTTTLAAARLTHTTPWAALRDLGHRLGIPELAELAATVALAGTEGARIRQSLTAKAAALRTRLLTDAETQANQNTERMSLPVILLSLAFLAFITYPALTQVLTGL